MCYIHLAACILTSGALQKPVTTGLPLKVKVKEKQPYFTSVSRDSNNWLTWGQRCTHFTSLSPSKLCLRAFKASQTQHLVHQRLCTDQLCHPCFLPAKPNKNRPRYQGLLGTEVWALYFLFESDGEGLRRHECIWLNVTTLRHKYKSWLWWSEHGRKSFFKTLVGCQ